MKRVFYWFLTKNTFILFKIKILRFFRNPGCVFQESRNKKLTRSPAHYYVDMTNVEIQSYFKPKSSFRINYERFSFILSIVKTDFSNLQYQKCYFTKFSKLIKTSTTATN